MATGFFTVDAPLIEPYRYGLLSALQTVIDDPAAHWRLGVQFDTDACVDGGIWDTRCEETFTVLMTRTATDAPNFTIDVSVGAEEDYNIAFNGGLFDAMSSSAIVPIGTSNTATICEIGGLHRCVTITGIDTSAAEGTQYSATSSLLADNDPKTADGLQTGFADAFAVYAGVDCRIVGLHNAGDKARRRLAAVEQRLVEQRVWENQIAIPTAVLATGSVTAVSLKAGIAALEEALGDNYGGIGIIHSPEWLTPYLADRKQLWPEGTKNRTGLGTVWAFGRGYTNTAPDGTPAEAGTVWLYATGAGVARRSPVFVPADLQTGAIDLSINDALVIAERQYAIILDCPLYAVHVTLEGE